VVSVLPSRLSGLRCSSAYCSSAYNACAAARLWRRVPAKTFFFKSFFFESFAFRPVASASFALMLALCTGGCSFSYQLDSLFGKKDDASLTGALQPVAARPLTGMPPEGDLAFARAAVSEVLSRGGKDASVPWENPKTGARGTVTPVSSAYSQDGTTCHEFLASYERDGSSAWLQGEACRANKGKWEVRNLKPWQRT
jgi:surface antigen